MNHFSFMFERFAYTKYDITKFFNNYKRSFPRTLQFWSFSYCTTRIEKPNLLTLFKCRLPRTLIIPRFGILRPNLKTTSSKTMNFIQFFLNLIAYFSSSFPLTEGERPRRRSKGKRRSWPRYISARETPVTSCLEERKASRNKEIHLSQSR